MSDPVSNSEYAQGLREIAQWLEDHPECAHPSVNIIENYSINTKEEAATVIRAFGECQKDYSDNCLYIRKKFGPITFSYAILRYQVCTARVVGKRRVEAYFAPAREEDILEWDCDPILQPEDTPKEENA